MNTLDQIEGLRTRQMDFFTSGATRDLKFRKESLKKLRNSIKNHQSDIKDALKRDLNKSSFEAYATEIGLVLHELRTQLRNLNKWARPKRVATPVYALPSSSYIVQEPYGRVLIISPWNYPFQMPLVPLIGAIAAGNVAVIRQSRNSPYTNGVIGRILSESLAEEHVAIIDCDIDTAEAALKLKWDLIFFTGSTGVGRKVYSEAALNLTPVILELGGKCPVVVDESASLKIAARRIIWGKLINAGQTCISPDYLLVHEKVREELIGYMKAEIVKMYGDDPINNPDYPRLISAKAFDRIADFIKDEKIVHGGRTDREKLSVEPTLIECSMPDKCMDDEIFGPVLPVIACSGLDEAIAFINSKSKPLALYFFSGNRENQKKMISETTAGACLINDVVLHIANINLPFGGVGDSGIGRYHGKESFRAFSNQKAVMRSSSFIDIPVKYPPFGKKERILKLFLK
jgi:aldehyde dehydrogenase (NAD+)